MALLGFTSWAEFVLFVTALVAGVTLIIGVNAVNSAPAFMLDYYKYLQDNPDATATYATFWAKVLTFYTVITEVTQGTFEPLNLTQFMCRFSLMFRLQASSLLMIIELLIILIMPHTHVDEPRAIAGIIIAAFIGGIGRAYFENTTFALFGPCPSKHLSAVMVGISISGCVSSVAQLILLSSMSSDYDSVRVQSIIYFAIALGIIVVCSLLLFAMHYNSCARRHIAELRARGGPWARVYTPVDPATAASSASVTTKTSGDTSHGGNGQDDDDVSNSDKHTRQQQHQHPREAVVASEPVETAGADGGRPRRQRYDGSGNDIASDDVAALVAPDAEQKLQPRHGSDDASGSDGEAAVTTSMLVQKVQLRTVAWKIYPMMLSCFGVYFVTYIMYPGALIAVDPSDKWFTTVLVAVYHFGDIFGRSLTLWRRLWLPRRVVMVGAAVRVVFVPLMVLCAVHKIPTHAAAYVIAGLLAVTNGFFGTLTMIYTPATPSLTSEGERVFAEQVAGVCLLFGIAGGSLLQLAVVLPFK